MEEKLRCAICDKVFEYVEDNDDIYVVNSELEDEFVECEDCHDYALENNIETHCECCGGLFTYDQLLENPKNSKKEICPYCKEIWCE